MRVFLRSNAREIIGYGLAIVGGYGLGCAALFLFAVMVDVTAKPAASSGPIELARTRAYSWDELLAMAARNAEAQALPTPRPDDGPAEEAPPDVPGDPSPPPGPDPASMTVAEMIDYWSGVYGLDAAGMQRVANCESTGGLRPIGPGSSRGVFQFEYATWQEQAPRHGLPVIVPGYDPRLDPWLNVRLAAALWAEGQGRRWACAYRY